MKPVLTRAGEVIGQTPPLRRTGPEMARSDPAVSVLPFQHDGQNTRYRVKPVSKKYFSFRKTEVMI
jgi:hypothetical protein